MLYQYTDINAVKSILENNEMWLTNVKYLNDKEEFTLGITYIKEAFFNHYKFANNVSDDCKKHIEIGFFNDEITRVFESMVLNSLYVASFSSSPDVLSQWRGYGNYSVGFDTPTMVVSGAKFDSGRLMALRCRYVKDHQDAIDYAIHLFDTEILHDVIECWDSSEQTKALLIPRMMQMICIYALTFKHYSFSEENESRFIYLNDSTENVVRFRTRNDMIIPYVSVPFPADAINSVTVGPINHQDLAVNSLKMFVEHIHDNQERENKINILKSEIPFRHL